MTDELRNLLKMQTINDGTRTLFESVMSDGVSKALRDWKAAGGNGVLIGGLAISYYVKPRMTQDVVVLMLSDADIPTASISGFKKTRKHTFQHNVSHVEVEIVTPEYVGVPFNVVKHVIDTSRESDGFWIASPSGIVALKLFRYNTQDRADIVALINFETIDLQGFGLPQDKIDKFLALIPEAEAEKKIPSQRELDREE